MIDHNISQLVQVLNAVEDAIYIIDNDYTIEYMNDVMIKLIGDGKGKKCYDLINNGNGICSWCNYKKVLKEGKTHYGEIFIPVIKKSFYHIELFLTNSDKTKSKLSIFRDITRRKEQEAKLKTSKEDYQRLFEHAGCGVFISSKNGRFIDVNPALLKMLGYNNKEEFLSIDLATKLYLTPEDRNRYRKNVEKEGSVVNYEEQWKHKNGKTLQILVTSNVRYDTYGNILGYEGIVIDQSNRKVLEYKMKKAHDFLDNIITCSPDAIMAADLKGNIILWNKGAEEIFKYKSEEVIGKKNIKGVYSEGFALDVMRMMRSKDNGGKGKLKSFPLTARTKTGIVVEGNLSASILYNEEGKEIATVGIFVDLGARLKMERKLSDTRQQLLHSEKLAAMGRLTSQVAHELNNPLFGIMNTLELMKTEISPQNRRRKLLDMSLSEIVRLADMLKKMLSFSRPDQEEKSNIEVNTVLEELILLYEKRLQENNIKLKASFMTNSGMVCASKNQLRQVFINIISNAMDAMQDGGSLTIKTDIISDKVMIYISDTGVGIKEEFKEKVFDSFFTTKTESAKGVGLGLSVCYGFIKDHKGDIKIESEHGKGTKFIISLPIVGNLP